jgi:hypothetical protein
MRDSKGPPGDGMIHHILRRGTANLHCGPEGAKDFAHFAIATILAPQSDSTA